MQIDVMFLFIIVLLLNPLFYDSFHVYLGAYAPFGYVLEGLEILQDIQPGDTITGTYVDEWGQLNLKKIKGGNFADAIQSADDEEDGEEVK
jgi:cyclophilin family peptidyl-prolyl cis-trans isomerase